MTCCERLAAEGTTIILITHKLREVLAITDRVTVLRGGRLVGSRETAGATAADLARMMVGTERMPEAPSSGRTCWTRPPVLRVENLRVNDDDGQVRRQRRQL